MGMPVLVLGPSGSGKSTSLRNFKPGEVGIINVLSKPLPFRTELKPVKSKDYTYIMRLLRDMNAPSAVIDDAGYLITDEFMSGHSSAGAGNAVYAMYNKMADNFYTLLRWIVTDVPEWRIVYIMMHLDQDDSGRIKPKTIGKLLDEKVCIEGLVTITLRCTVKDGRHIFLTNSTEDWQIEKSPIDMFSQIEIDNDLKMVDNTIREYWGLYAPDKKGKTES